jgi:hypothetical protein
MAVCVAGAQLGEARPVAVGGGGDMKVTGPSRAAPSRFVRHCVWLHLCVVGITMPASKRSQRNIRSMQPGI